MRRSRLILNLKVTTHPSISHASRRRSPARILQKLGPPAILAALTIVVFWKVALTSQYTWLNSPDLTEQVLPFLQEEARQWHQGELPLWDPHHWAGQSLLGQDQPGVLYPLNWLLSLMPYSNGHISLQVMDWYF